MYLDTFKEYIKTFLELNKIIYTKLSITGAKRSFYLESEVKITLNNNKKIYFKLSKLPTGCGSMIMSNYRESTIDEETGVIFKHIADLYNKLDKLNVIITCLGDSYGKIQKNQYQGILHWGFKELANYPNLLHLQPYQQKLYIKIIE